MLYYFSLIVIFILLTSISSGVINCKYLQRLYHVTSEAYRGLQEEESTRASLTQAQLNLYARLGLRTLCMAKRVRGCSLWHHMTVM